MMFPMLHVGVMLLPMMQSLASRVRVGRCQCESRRRSHIKHSLCSLWPALIFVSALFVATLTLAAASVADAARSQTEKFARIDKKLERCVYLSKKLERYTRLRRAGGSAVRMESWRRTRERYASEFRELRCHRFGRALRKAL